MSAHPLTTVHGIGETTAQRLAEQGIATPADLAAAPLETLAGLPGFNLRRAAAVREAAALALASEEEGRDAPRDELKTEEKKNSEVESREDGGEKAKKHKKEKKAKKKDKKKSKKKQAKKKKNKKKKGEKKQ